MTPTDEAAEFERLRSASEAFFGELGAWAYDEWARLNTEIFESVLEPGPIIWGLTPHGRSLGSYRSVLNLITLHTSLVQPTSESPWRITYLGKRYASDVLLHEMIHQKVHQLSLATREDISSHNAHGWCGEVNRIAKLLGLNCPEAVLLKQHRIPGTDKKTFDRPGYMTRAQLAYFPQAFRAKTYYDSKEDPS